MIKKAGRKKGFGKAAAKMAAFMCAAVMAVSFLAGCGESTKVVLTAGLKKNEVFRIEGASCTLPEAMVYLTNLQNQYEAVYGSEIWAAKENGKSLEQEAKQQVLTELAQIKVMNLLAKQKELKLDEKEQERAAAAAKEYFSSLSETEISSLNVTEELLAKMYGEYALASKVYRQIVENVNPEISDDEARTITVEAIRVSDRTKAQELCRTAKEEGTDFEALAQANSEDPFVTISFGKGEVGETLEAAAFDLGKDEISGVVEEGGSFYVLKCISTFDEAQTQANKEKILQQRRSEAFDSEYKTFEGTLVRRLNEELWDSVTMIHKENVTTSAFFEVYNTYFQVEQ